jgi:hypothetical protein
MILDFLARAFSVPLWPTSQMGLRDSFTPKTTDTDRNDSDDGSLGVEFRPYATQCSAGLGSCGHGVLVTDIRVWLFHRNGVLLRVLPRLGVIVALERRAG